MGEGVERITIDRIPQIRGSRKDLLKDRLFPEFTTLSYGDALKIETQKAGCTLPGVRFVIKLWNKNNPDNILTYTAKNSRKNPIIYIFRESKEEGDS